MQTSIAVLTAKCSSPRCKRFPTSYFIGINLTNSREAHAGLCPGGDRYGAVDLSLHKANSRHLNQIKSLF